MPKERESHEAEEAHGKSGDDPKQKRKDKEAGAEEPEPDEGIE